MLNTKKIIITGGDNCYCCRCGGVADRCVMEEDIVAKTLRYIDGHGLCLGKYCWHSYTCDDGTELKKLWSARPSAYRDVELPCAVRNNKWGKDGEYGTRGSSFWATSDEWKSGRVELRRWKGGADLFDEWYEDKSENKRDKYTEKTGWVLITK